MSKFQPASGSLSARIHGARQEMRQRAKAARDKADDVERAEPSTQRAAALRGKARGYEEAADLLAALNQGRRIPKRRRWTGWTPSGKASR